MDCPGVPQPPRSCVSMVADQVLGVCDRERERTLESLLFTAGKHPLQPIMYNLLNNLKHSRPGISIIFLQLVRFKSSKTSNFDKSEIISKEMQFETSNSIKLEGSGGMDLSSLQSDKNRFLRVERPFKLDGRQQMLLYRRFKISNDVNFSKSLEILPEIFHARQFSCFKEKRFETDIGRTTCLSSLCSSIF